MQRRARRNELALAIGMAVAAGAVLVKFGAPRTGERLNMQNCLLRMEYELGASARFAGTEIFRT